MESEKSTVQTETAKDAFPSLTNPRLKRIANLSVALGGVCHQTPELTAADVTLAALMLASCACLPSLHPGDRARVMSKEARMIGAAGGAVIVAQGVDSVAHVLIGLGDAVKAEAMEMDAGAYPATKEGLDELMTRLSTMMNEGHA